jgi:FMN phosphatase YigB (HAD superfamily)
MRKITAVTFDLWDTLIQEHPGGSDRLAKLRIEKICSLLSSRGIIHSKDEIGSAYKKTGDFLELTWSKRRDMPVHDQVLFMKSVPRRPPIHSGEEAGRPTLRNF